VGARATQLGSYEMTSGDFRRMFQFVDGIAAVTADEVKRVTARYLTAGRASIIYGRPR
jgi:predicted Zn-dependent peptidase